MSVAADCDRDTLLIQVLPRGPVCHLGTTTCFGDDSRSNFSAISQLEQTIEQRRKAGADNSYTAKLFIEGRDRITQKVGEEAVEVLIASKNPDDRQFIGECTDLIFHLTVLLVEHGLSWDSIYSELNKRSK
ncbi:hypothetical protein E3A20_03280 [Planctomyces bekefii]|uniref:Phosphoribosyl-ATP pyrophosphatase n=1 Tax=Planctomyces bekefii TaxID=1653850 RepID=A0A5C6MBV9_9PLAN|nr:hypothetical protein E3A20_03280 [Planctomyces bekefii]